MKKRGFTLVELLAVIAILAILVIVAMPNVLGMFNQAKVNLFVTEVQKIMDTSKSKFTSDSFSNGGQSIYYSSVENDELKTKELDISGNKKEYFIEMDRNGEFKRVVVYDKNFCYDVYSSGTNGNVDSTKSKLIIDEINKNGVISSDVWQSGSDSVSIVMDGVNYKIKGCEGKITSDGKNTNLLLDIVNIDGVDYQFVPYMTWKEWLESDYNTIRDKILACGDGICMGDETLRYAMTFCSFSVGIASSFDSVNLNEEIVKSSYYRFVNYGELPRSGDCVVGELYYDYSEAIKYDMKEKVYTE